MSTKELGWSKANRTLLGENPTLVTLPSNKLPRIIKDAKNVTFYAHKSNKKELLYRLRFFEQIDSEEEDAINHLIKTAEQRGYDFEILKYDAKTRNFSLIASPDWNTANEPITGDSRCYRYDEWTADRDSLSAGTVRRGRSTNPQIYHRKETFVSEDYDGFDIEKARARTRLLNETFEWYDDSPTDSQKKADPKYKGIKTQIGNQNFWFDLLDRYGISHNKKRRH